MREYQDMTPEEAAELGLDSDTLVIGQQQGQKNQAPASDTESDESDRNSDES